MSTSSEVSSIVLGCLSFLGALALFFLAIGISALLLMILSTISSMASAKLCGIRIADVPPPIIMAFSALLNGLVLAVVLFCNIDLDKSFWQAFGHGYVVGLIVLGIVMVPLELICVLLASCCSDSCCSAVDYVEMEG